MAKSSFYRNFKITDTVDIVNFKNSLKQPIKVKCLNKDYETEAAKGIVLLKNRILEQSDDVKIP